MKKNVRIYALTTCLWCKKTKKYFEDRGIKFNCVDYDKAGADEQQRIMDEIRAKGGSGSFPYVCIDGEVVQGYAPEEFEKLLKEKK